MFETIYIISPGNILSGGVSSLHNLCQALTFNKYNAKMYYVDVDENFIKQVLQNKFNLPRASKITDTKSNLLIVPETLNQLFSNYSNINKAVYWLSLKFFLKNKFSYNNFLRNYLIRKIAYPNDYIGSPSGIIDKIKQNTLYKGIKSSAVWQKDIIHITNSFYTYSFCEKMGASNINLLYNPLIDEIFEKKLIQPRKKQILVGARTSKLFKSYLKKSVSDYTIIHLKKMSIEKVYQLMSESMIYIDLSTSNRDRTPREAALLGCIVFTSKIGSARYHQDVPIPEDYKFADKLCNYSKIKKCIINKALNYDKIISDFDFINNRTIDEKNNFDERVGSIFENIQNLHFNDKI